MHVYMHVYMHALETFMGVEQMIAPGTNPRIPRVVSKSDRDHRMATTDNRNFGLTPAVTISRSNLSLGLYPIPSHQGNYPSDYCPLGPLPLCDNYPFGQSPYC